MKAKVGRGDGFRGVLDYALNSEKRAEIIGGTIAGLNARQLAAEFGMVRRLRPDAKRAVWHCSLSLPPGDHLSSEKWDAVVSDFMKEMGFSESTPYIAVRHRDTDHDHIHIVASRINLNGELWHGKWEARTAIEATQKLEKSHGLTLTPGLDNSNGRKALKKGEIEMALKTEKQPPKLKLQNIIDEALASGELTAVQFAETLAVAGIQVRANLASTGRFNGFSYELDGVAFKSSSLGKNYSWGSLQKRGVIYEQARDHQGLSRFAAAPAGASHKSAIRESGSDRRNSNGVREHQSGATSEHTSVSGRNKQQSNTGATAATIDAFREDGHTEQHPNKGGEGGGTLGESTETDIGRGMESDGGGGSDTAPTLEETDSLGTDNSTISKQSNNGWNARFKAASAKARDKRHADEKTVGQSNTGGNRIDARDLQATKQLDPRSFIERMGYAVKKDGQRHFSIRHGKDEAYRLTCKTDGAWVWVDKYGSTGGDNIDLVRELSGLDRFIDCVFELNGGLRATPVPMPVPVAPKPPRIPAQSEQGKMLGRMYLEERGISDSTINHAEKTGFLRYLSDGLLFVGYSAGKVWNATKRAFDLNAEIKKRDLAGSDKSKPQILEGNLESIWIVEGGIDALALHDIAKRQGKIPPTVIVSGGSGVKSFLENPKIMEMIRTARLVVVAGENEKNADVQAKTDAQHEAQLELVKALNHSAQAMLWKPESRLGSDVADYNLNVQNQKQEQKEIDATQKVKPNNFNM